MSGSTGNETSLGLGHYLMVLRRQRWLVLGIVILCLAAAAAYLVVAPKSVTATASVNVNVITTEPFNQQRPASGLLDPQTEADIASSHVVAKGASEILGGGFSPSEVRDASQVSSPGGASSIVKISFTGSSEAQATRGADAVAEAYLEFRSDQAEQRIATMLASTNSRIEDLNKSLLQANKDLAAASPGSTDYAQALSQLQQIQVELDSLLSHRNALAGVDTTGGVVLTSAEDSALEYNPSRKLTLATGLALGIVLGIIAAFVRNPFDRRLRSPADIAAFAGAPVLARLRGKRGAEPSDEQAREEAGIVRERLLAQAAAAAAGPDRGIAATPGPVLLFDARRADGPSRLVEMLEDDADASLSYEVVDSRAARSACLAALREVSAVVLISNPRTALTADVRWIRHEAAEAGVPLVGCVDEA